MMQQDLYSSILTEDDKCYFFSISSSDSQHIKNMHLQHTYIYRAYIHIEFLTTKDVLITKVRTAMMMMART